MLAAAALCLVVGIADGDTLTVRCGPGPADGYKEIRVRLSAIDAPEKGQPFGQRSKQALSDLCFDQRADLRTVATDRYGRTVAEVKCGGKDASAEMVRSGFAWVYDQYSKGYGALYPMQAAARAGRQGLWADSAPVPPWEFRHGPAARRPA